MGREQIGVRDFGVGSEEQLQVGPAGPYRHHDNLQQPSAARSVSVRDPLLGLITISMAKNRGLSPCLASGASGQAGWAEL